MSINEPKILWMFVAPLLRSLLFLADKKKAKAFSDLQYLLVISDFVAMKPRTSKESWVRRLDLLDGALHSVQDFT